LTENDLGGPWKFKSGLNSAAMGQPTSEEEIESEADNIINEVLNDFGEKRELEDIDFLLKRQAEEQAA
jgi:hypothetical protein